ncbi:MAG: YfhO family protein, partial [Clostridia bacterium]|nr:YfhO family protein [Clostridia bacterium]
KKAAEAVAAEEPLAKPQEQTPPCVTFEDGTADSDEDDVAVPPKAVTKQTLAAKWTALKPRLLRIGAVGSVAVITLCMVADVCVNTVKVATGERGVRTSNLTQYLHGAGVFDTFGPMYDSGEDTFYRVENNSGWTFNDGLLGGYKGITYYGSTMNGDVYQLMRALGNRVYTMNISTIYNPSSPVQNGLFGVRYFIDKGKSLYRRLEGLQQVAEYEDCVVMENPMALPLGFAVNDRISEFHVDENALHALATQNDLLNAMLGNDLNVFEHQPSHWEQVDGVAEYVYTCTSDQPVYVEQNFNYGSMDVTADGHTFKLDAGAELFKYLGRFAPGTEIRIRTDKADPAAEGKDMQFFVFNEAKWVSAYEQLMQSGLQVTSFKNTKVTGKVSMAQDGLLFTSIPQDGGWRVYVDGKKVDTQVVCDALLAVRLSGGEHTVTFRYRVPGIVLGVIVTLLALAFAAFLLWWCRKHDVYAPVKQRAKSSPKKKRVRLSAATLERISRSVSDVDDDFFDCEPEE